MIPEITHIITSLITNPPDGKKILSVKEAVTLALATPPLRYGLSTEYSLRRYRAMRRGAFIPVSPETRQMWTELADKVDNRMADNPDEDDFTAMEYVLSNESPSRYFLTPTYAEKLFYRQLSIKRSLARKRSFSSSPGFPTLPSSPRFKHKSHSKS